jgi:hypothetical protein
MLAFIDTLVKKPAILEQLHADILQWEQEIYKFMLIRLPHTNAETY